MYVKRTVARVCTVFLVLVAIQAIVYLARMVGADPVKSGTLPTELEAVGRVSGGLRRAMANLLWMKVDSYLHTGALTHLKLPMKDDPKKVVVAASGVSAEINIKELFPLMRLVVLLDPQFVKAGMTAGVYLIKMGKKLEGKRYIQDLIRYNRDHPRVYLLYSAIGSTLWRVQAYTECRPYLRETVRLYPRVFDEKLLARYGEPPADSNENLIYRGALAGLVHSAVLAEDYEDALQYWVKSGEFAPTNVYTKVLAVYTKMKHAGAIDREELSYRVKEWKAEDEAREAEKDKADKEAKLRSGEKPEAQPQIPPGTPEIEERGLRYYRVERKVQVIDLLVANVLKGKVGVIMALIVVAIGMGKRRGWLTR